MSVDVSKSWFAVLNNPAEHGFSGTPQEVCEQLRDEWVRDSTTRSGAWAYCVSAAGFHHVHMVLEDKVSMRFSAIKKSYAAGMHFEETKGTKQQAEDYIYKRYPFDEKGEQILHITKAGSIRGHQGKRNDIERIGELLEDGKTPDEILREDFAYYRYQMMIRQAFYDKRRRDVPPIRDVKVHLIIGPPGSGKSYHYPRLCEQYGEDKVYIVTDYKNGGMDRYAAEPYLFLDEYKGQLPYATFLAITDHYKTQIHARYTNVWALWNEVFITSVLSPESLYRIMVPLELQTIDSIEQMLRRFNDITYCYKDGNAYKRYTIPMSDYRGMDVLRTDAMAFGDVLPFPDSKDEVGG